MATLAGGLTFSCGGFKPTSELCAFSGTLALEASDTIGMVKSKIEKLEGIAYEKQKLIFRGRQLFNGNTLEDLRIQEGSTVQLAVF